MSPPLIVFDRRAALDSWAPFQARGHYFLKFQKLQSIAIPLQKDINKSNEVGTVAWPPSANA
jgi:hypothetical protein